MTDLRQRLSELDKERRAVKRKLNAGKPRRVIQQRAEPVAKGQREPRERDEGYLAWLRQLPCIACYVAFGLLHYRVPNEAAHQKLAIASRGWKEGGGGKRTHDRRCVPLCPYHHQHAFDACDKGQRKFWQRMFGDEAAVADLCADLYAAFKGGADGAAVIRSYAERASSARRSTDEAAHKMTNNKAVKP